MIYDGDLAYVRPTSGRRQFWGVIKSFLLDLIPNPLSFFRPWLNTVILIWKLKYSRTQVHEIQKESLNQLMSLSSLITNLSLSLREQLSPPHRVELEQEINQLIGQIEEKLYLFLSLNLQSCYHAQPQRWSLFDHLGELGSTVFEISHPWTLMEGRVLLLSELVKRDLYKEGKLLQELLVSQGVLTMLRCYRKRGLI